MEITNEEKIQELLNEPCWESKPYLIGMDKIGVEDVMERFAEWKDEEHAKEKQQWIDKACDTIKDLLGGYVIRNFRFGDSYDMDKIVNDFKKAMEE